MYLKENMDDKITRETCEALRNGDHKAFEVVFIAYFNKVKYFINGLLRSEEDAEELAQELFVKLWTSRLSIDLDKKFSTYLYVIARNLAFNFLKSKYVRESYANDPYHVEEIVDADEVVWAKELERMLHIAVEKMPDRRKEIFTLSRNEGLSNEEIATRLDISKKTVENQLSLALKELRQVISAILFFI